MRFGQLIIDHSRFEGPDAYETEIDLSGPLDVTTDEIPGLPFSDRTSIVILKEGQRLHCKLIVKRGTGKIHVKWRPVSAIQVSQNGNNYQMSFKNIGMLPTATILEQGVAHLVDAATVIPQNLFTRPLIPQNIPIQQEPIPVGEPVQRPVQDIGGVIGEDVFGVLGEELG